MKKALIWTLAGVTAVGLVATGVSVWALASGTGAPKTGIADAGQQRPVEGLVLDSSGVPALYTGDELEWLLLDEQGFADVLGITAVDDVSAQYGAIGESEGMVTEPEKCSALILEDFVGIVGFRARWASDTSAVGGRMDVRQFGSAENATAWAQQQLDVLDDCADFTIGSYGSSEPYASQSVSVLADESDDLSHVVVYDTDETGEWAADATVAIVVHGNTVIQARVLEHLDEAGGEALAAALQKHVKAAYATLSKQVR